MPIRYARVREAAAAVMQAALTALAAIEAEPVFVPETGLGWRRSGQETLVVVRRRRWRPPLPLSTGGWWDRLEPMTAFRDALAAHPDLGGRVDTLVGFEFSRTNRSLTEMLYRHLLEPLVTRAGGYVWDRAVFQECYTDVEAGLLAPTVRLVQVVPLLGFDLTGDRAIDLGAGLGIRLMSDAELSAVVDAGLPDQASGNTQYREVSRFYQCALVRHSTHAVCAGGATAAVTPPARLDECAQRLLIALRLVCGGSVTLGRHLQMQHPDDFDAAPGCTIDRSWSQAPDLGRPTILWSTDDLALIQDIMQRLEHPGVTGDRSLQMAIRRVMAAGALAEPEDRLVDLVIAGEALFIHGAGRMRTKTDRSPKRDQIAAGAVDLLTSDPVLGADPDAIEALAKGSYRRRNHEVHADPGPVPQIPLLDGSPAAGLNVALVDLEKVMRRACLLRIQQATTTP